MYFAYRALSFLRSARETAFPPFSSAAKRALVLSEKEAALPDLVGIAENRPLEHVLELGERVRVGDVDAELALGPPDVRVVRAARLAVGLVVDVKGLGALLRTERLGGIAGRPAVLVVREQVEAVLVDCKRHDLRPEVGELAVRAPHPLPALAARLAVLPVAVPVLVVPELEKVLAVRVLPEELHRAHLLLDPVHSAVAWAEVVLAHHAVAHLLAPEDAAVRKRRGRERELRPGLLLVEYLAELYLRDRHALGGRVPLAAVLPDHDVESVRRYVELALHALRVRYVSDVQSSYFPLCGILSDSGLCWTIGPSNASPVAAPV